MSPLGTFVMAKSIFVLLVVVVTVSISDRVQCHQLLNTSTTTTTTPQQHHRIVKRLVGGQNALLAEAQFVVQLIRKNRTICTGSIIAEDLILTATHCTSKGVDSIVYGTVDGFIGSSSSKTFKSIPVKSIYTHPDYLQSNMSTWLHDIAILKLYKSVLTDPIAQSIELQRYEDDSLRCGSVVRVYGFGKVYAKNETFIKQKCLQVMETQVQNRCMWSNGERFHQYIITKMDNKTVCHGDSGGPLVSSNGRLIGITSRSFCVRGKRDVFVKISSHMHFINKFMSNSVKVAKTKQTKRYKIKKLIKIDYI